MPRDGVERGGPPAAAAGTAAVEVLSIHSAAADAAPGTRASQRAVDDSLGAFGGAAPNPAAASSSPAASSSSASSASAPVSNPATRTAAAGVEGGP